MLTRTLSALAALLLVSACASDTASLDRLRAENFTGDAYAQALASNYKAFAEELADRHEWGLARYYAEKGLAVVKGREVSPEDPTAWNFPEPPLNDLQLSHDRVVKAIEGARTTQPEMAASAMVGYDKLLTEHHFQSDARAIATQQSTVGAVLTKLEEPHTPSESAEIPPPSVPSELNRTIVYFPFDSAALGDSALSAIAELARAIPDADDVSVAINGHADRAGPEAYNMKLSERRAKVVEGALAKAGVPKKRMNHYAFGETDPAIATEDGVAEPKNRRVEITVE